MASSFGKKSRSPMSLSGGKAVGHGSIDPASPFSPGRDIRLKGSGIDETDSISGKSGGECWRTGSLGGADRVESWPRTRKKEGRGKEYDAWKRPTLIYSAL